MERKETYKILQVINREILVVLLILRFGITFVFMIRGKVIIQQIYSPLILLLLKLYLYGNFDNLVKETRF